MSDAHDDFFDRCTNAKPVSDRPPFMNDGEHHLALLSYRVVKTEKHGKALAADFVVLASTTHAVGSLVTKLWLVNRAPNFPGDDQEAARARDFMVTLTNNPDPVAAGQMMRYLSDPANKQPGRGMQTKARVSTRTNKKSQKAYSETVWVHVEQTREQIVELGKQLSAQYPDRPEQPATPTQPAAIAPQAYPQQYAPPPATAAPTWGPTAAPQAAPAGQPSFLPPGWGPGK